MASALCFELLASTALPGFTGGVNRLWQLTQAPQEIMLSRSVDQLIKIKEGQLHMVDGKPHVLGTHHVCLL